MRNSTLNWETPGDFDRLGYLNDALEETYKDVRYHHEEEKIRYRKHRKAAFKKAHDVRECANTGIGPLAIPCVKDFLMVIFKHIRGRANASICMAGTLTAAISSP